MDQQRIELRQGGSKLPGNDRKRDETADYGKPAEPENQPNAFPSAWTYLAKSESWD
mgnify:CR=1 FL=1